MPHTPALYSLWPRHTLHTLLSRHPTSQTRTYLRHLHPDESNKDDDYGDDARPVAQVVAEDLKELQEKHGGGRKAVFSGWLVGSGLGQVVSSLTFPHT